MSKVINKNNIEVNQYIKHSMCGISGKIVFITDNYLVYEKDGHANILNEDLYGIWKLIPRVFKDLDEDILRDSYKNSTSFKHFLLLLDRQDFKESSLP